MVYIFTLIVSFNYNIDYSIKYAPRYAKDAAIQSANSVLWGDKSPPFVEVIRAGLLNIKLAGEKWFGLEKGFDELRIYEIISIDFRIPGEEIEKYPQYLIKLIAEVGEDKVVSVGDTTDEYIIMGNDKKDSSGKRDFVGKLCC